MKKAVLCFFFGMVILSFAWNRVYADTGPKLRSGLYMPVGINLGCSIHEKPAAGFILGAEVSLNYFSAKSMLWIGGYTDFIWDFGTKAFRFSVGPQFGWGIIGIELGYLYELDNSKYHQGTRIGVVLTLAVVTIYGRWGHFSSTDSENNMYEVGVLYKFPIGIFLDPASPSGPQ
jgi:hypothetical protein